MSIEVLIGLAATIVCGLIGVIYWAGQSRDDKQDSRFDRAEKALDDHSKEDSAMHERIVRVETKVETLEAEVGKLREMRHEILDRVTHSISEWYVNIMDRLKK
jgi:uncharacterized protein YhaN